MNVADAASAVQQITADVIAYMTDMGVDPGLLQLSLKYDSDDIRYLSGSEMEQYHLALNGAKTASGSALSAGLTPSPPAGPSPPSVAPPLAPVVASLPTQPETIPSFDIAVALNGRIQSYDGKALLKASATSKSATIAAYQNGSPLTILDDNGKWNRTFDQDGAEKTVDSLKASGSIPDDPIATWGNAFVRKVL